MPTDTTSTNSWPLPTFRFEVDFNDQLKGVPFQEITGLDSEPQVIEYRHPESPLFPAVNMPGITKCRNITFKRGSFENNDIMWNWMNQVKMNMIVTYSIIVRLLDESGHTTMQWTLINAWPTKITSTDLKSDGNEVAVDTVEVACEGIMITNG